MPPGVTSFPQRSPAKQTLGLPTRSENPCLMQHAPVDKMVGPVAHVLTWVAPSRGCRVGAEPQREDWSNENESTLCRSGCTQGIHCGGRSREWTRARAAVGNDWAR